ncbi:unnamed protein product [Sympodiomycopsis kandeliae]
MSTPTQASVLALGPPSARTHVPSSSSPTGMTSIDENSVASSSSSSSWIVQKYGGTSVGKFLPTITSQIVPSYLQSNATIRLALVCSARSGSTKAKGTTNLLLKAADQALKSGSSALNRREDLSSSNSSIDSVPAYEETIEVLLQEHLSAIDIAVKNDGQLKQDLERDVRGDCERLRQFLYAAKIIEEISPRSQDIIMSLGERLSCRLICAALQDLGIPSELVGMESVIDPEFLEEVAHRRRTAPGSSSSQQVRDGDESFLDQHFYDHLATKMGEKCRNVVGVPVVTGYFGAVPGSLLSAVGRGYTDLCAALCAVGLNALELQIWKEVDGVFTADPRKVSTARLIPSISPEEAAELTYYGSEVIHPFTMEQAIRRKVPIRIKNVENPAGMGTVILPDNPDAEHDHLVEGHVTQPQTPSSSGVNTPARSYSGFPGLNADALAQLNLNQPGGMGVGEVAPAQRRLPTAVTIKEDVIVLNVHSNRKTLSHSFFSRIFSTLDRHGVAVDLISTSEVHVSMAISSLSLKRPFQRTLDVISSELGVIGTVSILKEMTILSLVGRQMRHMVGVAGKMFTTLAEGGINIEMISQGANEINISCCIHSKNALKALNLIHYSVLEVTPKPSNMESGNFGRSFV